MNRSVAGPDRAHSNPGYMHTDDRSEKDNTPGYMHTDGRSEKDNTPGYMHTDGRSEKDNTPGYMHTDGRSEKDNTPGYMHTDDRSEKDNTPGYMHTDDRSEKDNSPGYMHTDGRSEKDNTPGYMHTDGRSEKDNTPGYMHTDGRSEKDNTPGYMHTDGRSEKDNTPGYMHTDGRSEKDNTPGYMHTDGRSEKDNTPGYMHTDGRSPLACGSEKDGHGTRPVWAGCPPEVNVPGMLPYAHGTMDPLALRFQCSCQSAQCQLSYSDYLLESQSSQYNLAGLVPGPPESSQHGSASAPWFPNEPILCSMMPGDLHDPFASICLPPDYHGLTELTSHNVVCDGDGEAILVNPCEQEPVFLTLTSAQGNGGNVLGTPSQLPQHHQTTCPMHESRDMQPPAPPARTAGTLCDAKSRKPCHCTRSQCLKLYCECFANGVMCSNCDCSHCHNNAEHDVQRLKAVTLCLGRNPDAFKSKFAGGKTGGVKGQHSKGCNCKRSGCLKNYCECYEANIMCTSSCKCVGCRNYDDGSDRGPKEKTSEVISTWPVSAVTPSVVEAVCGCLLAKAEEAEAEAQSGARAEHAVLGEFGHCLSQIVKAMFKYNTH